MTLPFRSIVRLHAFVTLDANDWNAFLRLVADVRKIVSLETPGHVIVHETYHRRDTLDCLIVEAYADEKAFLEHLEKVRPLLQEYNINWRVNRMELSGAFSSSIVAALRESVDGEFIHYEELI